MDSTHAYREELDRLVNVTLKLNETNNFALCLVEDGENCVMRSVNYTCATATVDPPAPTEPTAGPIDCGSTSTGSGSGSAGNNGSDCTSGDRGPIDLEGGPDIGEGDESSGDKNRNASSPTTDQVDSNTVSETGQPTVEVEVTKLSATTGKVTTSEEDQWILRSGTTGKDAYTYLYLPMLCITILATAGTVLY